MATAPSVTYLSVDEYLHTAYSPDVDYVDDHIEERNLGEYDHADLQSELLVYFRGHSKEWGVRTVVEIRVQVRERNFRIPDVCITDASLPREQIIRTPPLLCLEVVSPEDTLKRLRVRAQDFLTMGVAQVWIFNPKTRRVLVSTPQGETEHTTGTLSLPGTAISLEVDAIFRTLDEN